MSIKTPIVREPMPRNRIYPAIISAVLTMLAIMCLLPGSVKAAPVNTAATTSADTSGDKSEAFTVPAGSNLILIVGCAVDSNADSITSVTYNSVSLSLLQREAATAGISTEIWYLTGPATGSNTLVVDSSNNSQEVACGYLVYSGVDQSTPFTGTTTSADGTTPYDIAVTCAAGNLAIDIMARGANVTLVVDGGQTQRALANGFESGAASFGMSEETAAGSMTMTWTDTNGAGSHIATCLMARSRRAIGPIIFQ